LANPIGRGGKKEEKVVELKTSEKRKEKSIAFDWEAEKEKGERMGILGKQNRMSYATKKGETGESLESF